MRDAGGQAARRVTVTIASWLVRIDKGRGGAVRRALSTADLECRSEAYDTLVVLSDSGGQALDDVRRRLGSVAGVRDVALVARFDDDPDEPPRLPRDLEPCAALHA
jgi:hypothetical protein